MNSLIAIIALLFYTLALGIPALMIVWFLPGFVLRMSHLWVRLILASMRGVRVEVQGKENLSPGGQYVFLSNHQGALDIPALMTALPRSVRFIAKKELARIPIFGWAMVALGHVTIDRKHLTSAKESMDRAVDRIRREKLSIIAFPEGTRTKNGKVLPFKKGVFILAIQAKVPVVPVSIRGSFEIFPKGKRSYLPGKVRVQIHPPISTDSFEFETKEQLLRQVRDIIVRDVEGGQEAENRSQESA